MTIEADVVIIGTGTGGGIAAQMLAAAGKQVVMIEEGPYRTTKDFHMQEAEAYPDLYFEVASRKTRDKAITILQGRTVGGGTTVNWTSCFPIPQPTLAHWREVHGWQMDDAELAPWYEHARKQLSITPWPNHNPSNAAFARGATQLGWHHEVIARNVRGCRNLGFCGLGCPVGAKQSTLVTSIPAALERGARLYTRLRAQRLIEKGGRIVEVECQPMSTTGADAVGSTVRIRAQQVILAAGGIGSPALLLRSRLPDPDRLVGKRTFLHPTVGSIAIMPERIDPYYGAPQTITSDEFLWRDGITGGMGYKMESAPLHPALAATVFAPHGQAHADMLGQISHAQPLIALMRDGFHERSPGGSVRLNADGTPVLDYPLCDYHWHGMRHAYGSMLELQFAAGAKQAMPAHADAKLYRSWREARQAIKDLPIAAHQPKVFSAHVMGGCAMGSDPASSVVNLEGRHHAIENLYVFDGSIFPTSIGANPMQPIAAMVARLSSKLV